MVASTRYVEELRTIGQMLETKAITDFELKRLKQGYAIEDMHEHRASLGARMRSWVRLTPHRAEIQSLTVTAADIENLSEAGKARRSKSGQVTQFRDLSNVLRTIGAYLDAKEVELLELQKRPISVTLQYRDRAGNNQREDRPLSSFYKVFLELYDQRRQ